MAANWLHRVIDPLHRAVSGYLPHTQAVDDPVDSLGTAASTGGQSGDNKGAHRHRRLAIHSEPGHPALLSTGPVPAATGLTCQNPAVPRIHRPYDYYFLSISRMLRTK